MLDETNTLLTSTAAWKDHVSYGDIVSFRFPLADEEESAEAPKARPCLILDIEEIGGQRYALLAYGTASHRRSNVGYEIHVRRRAEYLSAGLGEPTRFVGARRLLVPLTHEGFDIRRILGSPVLGRLDGAPFEAMNAVRGRIHAEADIAADRRSRRRRDREVTVASRQPPAATNSAGRKGGAAMNGSTRETPFEKHVDLCRSVLARRHEVDQRLRSEVWPHLGEDARGHVQTLLAILDEEPQITEELAHCLVSVIGESRATIAAGTTKERIPIPKELLIGCNEAFDRRTVRSPEAEALHDVLPRLQGLHDLVRQALDFAEAIRLSLRMLSPR